MCVLYRKLNSVTKPFEFPIPRCNNLIAIIGAGADIVFLIMLDTHQGYHQVSVRVVDRKKLVFFAPYHTKWTFNIMPFGPTNVPAFHSAMMLNFKTEWTDLFIEMVKSKAEIGLPVCVNELNEIFIGMKKVISGSRTIIDDILLWVVFCL